MRKEPRNIYDVTDQLLAVLPQEHHARFIKMKSDFGYKPPEMMWECWEMLGRGLRMIAKWPPVEQWEWDCAAIITDKSLDELQRDLGYTDKRC